jgi:predicted nucleic acid-binding protein
MNNTIFIDADVILDLLCKREPFYESAAELFTLGDKGKLHLATTSLVYANVFYILRKILGIEKAKELLRKLRLIVHVIPIDEKMVDLALNSQFSDFEDGLQYFTARENDIGIILTRNVRDYKEKELLIQTPEEYLKTFFMKEKS